MTFRFGNLFYYNKSLPIGASISYSVFGTFATFLEYKTKWSRGPISRVDKQRNEPGRWKSRIVAIFLLFLTLLHVLT